MDSLTVYAMGLLAGVLGAAAGFGAAGYFFWRMYWAFRDRDRDQQIASVDRG